jgi:hypothetical protein
VPKPAFGVLRRDGIEGVPYSVKERRLSLVLAFAFLREFSSAWRRLPLYGVELRRVGGQENRRRRRCAPFDSMRVRIRSPL